MRDPQWKCIAQLGDVNPIDHNGFFVYEDTTGQNEPEAEKLFKEWEKEGWTVYRFNLTQCLNHAGVLSDNRFHPDHPAWFAEDLQDVCDCMDISFDELVDQLCSDDIVQRAHGYQAIADYHGYHNFDQCPLTLNRRGVLARYRKELK